MLNLFNRAKDAFRSLHVDERAQDGFEYVIIIGVVVVAIITAIATPVGDTLIDAVVGNVTTAVNGLF